MFQVCDRVTGVTRSSHIPGLCIPNTIMGMPAHLLYPGVLPNVMSPLDHTLSTGMTMVVAASKVDVTTHHPNGYGYVTGDNL